MIAAIVGRLEAAAPVLRHVAGAADFAAVAAGGAAKTRDVAAWVVPEQDTAAANNRLNAVRQRVTRRIGVILAVTRHGDARGEPDAVGPARAAVRGALLGWQPPEAEGPLVFVGGRLAGFTAGGVLWWQDSFAADIWIED